MVPERAVLITMGTHAAEAVPALARRLGLCGAIAVAALLLLTLAGSAFAAAPPTGNAEASIATAPAGAVAGSVDAGELQTCAVRTNATLACWCANFSGQATPPPGTFTAVSGGANHSCGVRTNGSVACWGHDDSGEDRPPAGTFRQVSAGYNYACGVRTDGSVACWGDNSSGQADPPGVTFL